MNIEQIKEELTMLEGHLLQNAIDNTDGTVGEIKQYLISVVDTAFENSSSLDTSDAFDCIVRTSFRYIKLVG